jgi:hypothetical protein
MDDDLGSFTCHDALQTSTGHGAYNTSTTISLLPLRQEDVA